MGKLRGTSAWGSVQRSAGGDPLNLKRGQPLLRLRHCGPFARGHGGSDSVQGGDVPEGCECSRRRSSPGSGAGSARHGRVRSTGTRCVILRAA